MGEKEVDKVRMLGVIPSINAGPIPVGKIPDDATQIAKHKTASNETDVIHTVTTGKTFYLSACSLGIKNASGAFNHGNIQVTDGSDTMQYVILYVGCPDDNGKMQAMNFLPPLEIQAGWKVKDYSPAVAFTVSGFIHGYEI